MTNVRATILFMAVVISVASSPVLGWGIDFNDGGIHDIDYVIDDRVRVDYEAPGMETTFNLLDGGKLEYDLAAYENSQINILGGSIEQMLWAVGSSQVDISGGNLASGLHASESSQVDISGGSIVSHLWAFEGGQVDISGGSICTFVATYNSAVLTIHGSDFAVDGAPFGYGELTSILGGEAWDEPQRYLTGTLASGELISINFRIGHDAKIVLVPSPVTLSGWVWMVSGSGFGYSLEEGNFVYFLSSGPVWYYNFTTGLWDSEGPAGWIYVDWPFYYILDTGYLMFALPPESGLWVYHFSTGQWELLPRIIP